MPSITKPDHDTSNRFVFAFNPVVVLRLLISGRPCEYEPTFFVSSKIAASSLAVLCESELRRTIELEASDLQVRVVDLGGVHADRPGRSLQACVGATASDRTSGSDFDYRRFNRYIQLRCDWRVQVDLLGSGAERHQEAVADLAPSPILATVVLPPSADGVYGEDAGVG